MIQKLPMKSLFLAGLSLLAALCASTPLRAEDPPAPPSPTPTTMSDKSEKIILAGGCFWCTEAVYERVEGVTKVESGYAGGHVKNPTYQQVSGGGTGHTEVIQVTFNPDVVPLDYILEVFWAAHDPTSLNRQGPDTGTQYRSAIYYFDDAQKAVVEKSLAEAQKKFDKPIVTEIKMAPEFYVAEDYHQNFYAQNPDNRYCSVILLPKLKKLEKDKLIKEERVTDKVK